MEYKHIPAPHTEPDEIGLTNAKLQRLGPQYDQRKTRNSVMPGILSQNGHQQTVFTPAIVDILESGNVPRRPIETEGQVNPDYVNEFPIYPHELKGLMRQAGEEPGSMQEMLTRLKNTPDLEERLFYLKAQPEIDTVQKMFPNSTGAQLGWLADQWDVDARTLKTIYRTYGGML